MTIAVDLGRKATKQTSSLQQKHFLNGLWSRCGVVDKTTRLIKQGSWVRSPATSVCPTERKPRPCLSLTLAVVHYASRLE